MSSFPLFVLSEPLKPYARAPWQDYVHSIGGTVALTNTIQVQDVTPDTRTGGNVVVAMGEEALQKLTGKTGITKYRGSILPSTFLKQDGVKIIPTYHPNKTAFAKYIWRYDVLADMQRVREENKSARTNWEEPYKLIIKPSVEETLSFLRQCEVAGRFAHDIETYGQHSSCMSFAYDDHKAICIPFYDGTERGKVYWSLYDEMRVWDGIAKLFANPMVEVIGQNYIFDMSVMALRYGIVPAGTVHDTMIGHSILYPDLQKGLDYLCSIYTDIPYYKADRKSWQRLDEGEDVQSTFWKYSARDAIATWLVWKQVQPLLKSDPSHYKTYQTTMALHAVALYMCQRGIAVNRPRLDQVRKETEAAVKTTIEDLNKVADYEFNPNSPSQCVKYFYGHKKIRPYLKQGRPTTDDKALQRIAKNHDSAEARLIQKFRGLNKFLTSSLSMEFDKDDRMRCSISLRGTKFGRWSTSKTVFNTGGNMQNLDVNMKKMLRPDPGYFFFEFDLAGAEWVVSAYYSKDQRMIGVCSEGLSPHVETAKFMFNAPEELIKEEDKLLGHETSIEALKQGRAKYFPDMEKQVTFLPRNMTMRQAAKRSNHGLNYGLQFRAFALYNDMLEADAKRLIALYHNAYPGIHAMHRDVIKQLQSNDRTLYNCFGRKQRFLGFMGDDLYRAAFAFVPQSTVVDVFNTSLLPIWEDPALQAWEPLMNVHDSVLFQVPQNTEGLAEQVHKIVEHLSPTLCYHNKDFTIKVDVKCGTESWASLSDLPLASISTTKAHIEEQKGGRETD